MLERITVHKTCRWVCFLMVLCTSCNSGIVELANNGNDNAVVKGDDTLYHLDNKKRSIVQPIEPKKGEVFQDYKFVQVEVIEILNPKRYALSFEVRYQSRDGGKTYLGSFSPYPADNPGKFIVATQGKLRNEGAIILTLVIQDQMDTRDTINVTVKKMKFLKDR